LPYEKSLSQNLYIDLLILGPADFVFDDTKILCFSGAGETT